MKKIVYAFCLLVFVFGVGMVYRAEVVADNNRVIAEFQNEVPRECFFEEDSSALTAEAIANLDAQIAWMKKHPQYSFLVRGFAAKAEDENDTSAEYALMLGERRTMAVREYLIANGIAVERINTISFGQNADPSRPAEAKDRAKIRRTETVLEAPEGVE